LKVLYKVWLDNDGKAFGDGPYERLRWVEKTRSLHRAARQMDMAYSKAWTLVRSLESRLGFSLIERKVGGTAGGGSTITAEGKDFMERYRKFRTDAGKALEKTYAQHFGAMEGPEKKGRSGSRHR
jgi:molybdate transport system regulatory protein